MEYRRVYSFVGRRSTTAETTAAAAAAHLGVTTYTFLVFVPGTFMRVLYNINHHECSFRKRVGRGKKTPSRTNQQSVVQQQQQQQQQQQRQPQQKPAAPAPAPAPAAAAVEAEAAKDAESTSEHLRIQQYAILFRFNFWRRKNRT